MVSVINNIDQILAVMHKDGKSSIRLTLEQIEKLESELEELAVALQRRNDELAYIAQGLLDEDEKVADDTCNMCVII